jgi:hypothetical protein
MEYGINVDSLQKVLEINNNKNNKEEIKKSKETEKYKSKIVEYTFFVQNEIEVCDKLNTIDKSYQYNSAYRFLTIKKYDFVKVCESNKQILEKMNIDIDLTKNANNKKIVLLKYKKDVENGTNNDQMSPFIDSFFYHHHLNNTSLFPDKPRASFIFWEFLNIYEALFDDLLYLANKDVMFLDFSSKNLLYNKKHTVFFNKFDKCLIRKEFDVSTKIICEHDVDLQKLSKYIEIESYIDKFIKIIESIEYYGNKHFDLYFSKHLIKSKNFYSVYQNLDTIINDYLNNLQFLKNFSDKFINDNKNKWKALIKNKIEENLCFLNMDKKNINWKLYLLLLLENSQKTIWETFSLNNIFLNITYYMMKIFDIKDKTSVVHRYFKFLFLNMDINCTSFNNNNNNNNTINISICRRNYDKVRDSFEDSKDLDNLANFCCLSHVNMEQQQELYDLLLQSIDIQKI